MVEEDGDEIFIQPVCCFKCRLGFSQDGQPIYAPIVEMGGFYKCTNCNGSYGPVELSGSSRMIWSRTHPAQRECQERVHIPSVSESGDARGSD